MFPLKVSSEMSLCGANALLTRAEAENRTFQRREKQRTYENIFVQQLFYATFVLML